MNTFSPPRLAARSLHVIGGKGLGGAERFFIRLVNALAQQGFPVAAVTVATGEISPALHPAVQQYHAPMLGVWDMYSRWRIRRAIADFQPDVVQTYMGRATRIVRLPRHTRPVHVARLGGYYNLKGYRHAHAWIGNTRGIHDYLIANNLPARQVHTLGNFVDTPARCTSAAMDRLRAQWQLEDAMVVLGLGRLHPNKGWEDLLQAFAQLPERAQGKTLQLLMVGDGPLRENLSAQARRLGIASRVKWAGWQQDPSPYYQLADVFVCASIHEPLGNVILEAWANRVLVVSTRAQGPLELMQDGVNGLLAPVSDAATLSTVIHTALNLDSCQRQEIIEAGHREIELRYSQEAIVSAYVSLYDKLRADGNSVARHVA